MDEQKSVVMQGGGDNSVMMSANNSMQGSNVMQGSNAMQGSNSMMMAAQAAPKPADLPAEGDFPDLSGAVTWLNSPPLTPAALKGKVVLIDFWTYSCINCLRTIPYVRAWAEKYKDQGLVVIGVHAPEFASRRTSITSRRRSPT